MSKENVIKVNMKASQAKPFTFHEVSKLRVVVCFDVVIGVVHVERVRVQVADLTHLRRSLHFHPLCARNDVIVEEVVRVDFVDGRQNDSGKVVAMENGHRQSVDEHSGVDVVTCPHHKMVESVPVLSVVEHFEHGQHLLVLISLERSENLFHA